LNEDWGTGIVDSGGIGDLLRIEELPGIEIGPHPTLANESRFSILKSSINPAIPSRPFRNAMIEGRPCQQ
jgi:hypothetical protein